jgi:RNA polymerase sigma-70 factor (ECF subfamily)
MTFGDRHAAEDMLQETMLRAWRNFDGLHANIETLRPWLLTVARRIAIDSGRARRVRPAEVGTIDMSAMADAEDTIDRMLASETIRQALLTLSPEHRSVIVEMYFRGRSCAEAAELLDIPVGTVKSRAHHALRALRHAIGSLNASA